MLYADVAAQESDGGCEGSDAEMIGNGRRGAGDRNRDLEEDDELESREERGSESGGGGGGFGGWRSHLLGGLTQRVKSWYWGARPLVSFPIHCEKKNRNLFLSYSWYARFRFISLLPSSLSPRPFLPSVLSLTAAIRHFTPALTRERVRGQGRPWKGKENGSGRTSEKFSSKIEFDTFRRYFIPIFIRSIGVCFTRKISYVTISIYNIIDCLLFMNTQYRCLIV